MQLHLETGKTLNVITGCFKSDIISPKSLLKIDIDGADAGFIGFLPLDSADEHSYMQREFTALEAVSLTKKENKQIAKLFLEHVENLLTNGTVANPVFNESEGQIGESFLTVEQTAAVAAILYSMKLRKGHKAVVGSEPYLSVEELIFIEDCLKLSPYLKSKGTKDVQVSDFSIAVEAAYREILKQRNGQESLVILGFKELQVIYSDYPVVLEEDDDIPL